MSRGSAHPENLNIVEWLLFAAACQYLLEQNEDDAGCQCWRCLGATAVCAWGWFRSDPDGLRDTCDGLHPGNS